MAFLDHKPPIKTEKRKKRIITDKNVLIMATNIGQVKVLHLATNRVHYYNFGTWANHRRIEKQSGVKMYRILKTIPASGSNTTAPSINVEVENNQVSRGLTQNTAPPKRKKKRCNC